MGERYWLTGVQLGVLFSKKLTKKQYKDLLDQIHEHQYIGAMPEPYDDYKIVVVKKSDEQVYCGHCGKNITKKKKCKCRS